MLVLDANILIRAVLGRYSRSLLAKYGGRIDFIAPEVAFEDAGKTPAQVLARRELDPEPFMAYFDLLTRIVRTVERPVYADRESIAKECLARRDIDDWPILAAALALRCPIWTEDTDFFGCGVATLTTDRVHLYLSGTLFNEPIGP